jgi:hypothetical protein
VSGKAQRMKKERRTKAAPSTPAKGPLEQHLADAPFRERGTSTASKNLKSLAAQVGCLLESSSRCSRNVRVVSKLPIRAGAVSQLVRLEVSLYENL